MFSCCKGATKTICEKMPRAKSFHVVKVQPKKFAKKCQEKKVFLLQRSIYRLKKAFRLWNMRFDLAIKSYGYSQVVDEPCVCKKIEESKLVFLVLCEDDILIIGNNVGAMITSKVWLTKYFDMKDLGKANYALEIQIIRDRKNSFIPLSKLHILTRSCLDLTWRTLRKCFLPFRYEVKLSKEQSPKNAQEEENMKRIPYASAVESLIYVMLCTKPDICFVVKVVSRF